MKRRKIRVKPLTRIIIYIIIFVMFNAFCEKRVDLLPSEYLSQNAKNYTEQKINEIISKELISIKKQHTIKTTEENKISYIELNAIDISVIKANLSKEINSKINGNQICFIPVGNLINYNFLTGFGFSLPINMYFIGNANVEISTNLVSGGINQSIYSLVVNVDAELCTAQIKNNASVKISSNYPLCEVYIAGQVPSYTRY